MMYSSVAPLESISVGVTTLVEVLNLGYPSGGSIGAALTEFD
jgi:hypothetical protein